MKGEIKRLLGKFLLITVVILSLTAVSAGGITVKERGEYNIYLTKYAVMSFSNDSEKLTAKASENRLKINLPLKKLKGKIEEYVCYTPFSLPYNLIKFIR